MADNLSRDGEPSRDSEPVERRLAELEEEVATLRDRLAKAEARAEAARESEAWWRRSEQRLHLILESATEYAIFTLDQARRVTNWNTGAQRLLGYEESEIIGQSGDLLFTPEDREKGAPEWETATAHAEGRAVNERWHLRKGGTRFWGSGLVMPLRDPEDGFLKILRDRTEQQQADERQRLLVGELNHRVKNILMTVQSLVGQTLRSTKTREAFAAAISSRLSAMARAHDLLTDQQWRRADITAVVRAALAPWLADGRLSLSGPPVSLRPQHILPISMALHELATNALKYGALSVPEGRVTLIWRYANILEAEWRESGGPPVTPPTRQGFGSRVLNRALAAELGGTVDLRFEPTGVVCLIQFELDTEPPTPPFGPAED
ncbi:MAG TPA: HWE histidine kinase domain-containing protein [Roseomonas sp.]|nr:HWE histidine kinase domain-containing protein [Roseomonas sp.]